MNDLLSHIKLKAFDNCDLELTDFMEEKESKEYQACRFSIEHKNIFYRTSKITPKKKGQFVTFYQRNDKGIIEPFSENEVVDFFIISLKSKSKEMFVFPKSVLINKGILSANIKEGKRAFRVYVPYDIVESTQALTTQKWQSDYFYDLSDDIDKKKIQELF